MQQQQYEEPRSIFQNLKLMVQGATDTVTHTAHATSTLAQTGDSLAKAGLIMAKSNERLVTIKVAGQEAMEMDRLKSQFPDLELEV